MLSDILKDFVDSFEDCLEKIKNSGLHSEAEELRKIFIDLKQNNVRLEKEVEDLEMEVQASYGKGKKRKKWDDE
jgi:hypothetical protein